MKNQPLTSNDHAKLLVFSFIMLPAVLFFGVGLIPAIFLGLGVFMMKKHKNFSYIETAVKCFNYYNYIFISIVLVGSLYWFFQLINDGIFTRHGFYFYETYHFLYFSTFSITALICFLYTLSAKFLFCEPLKNHSEWVEANGIFSSKVSTTDQSSKVSIIRGENLKQYSVADELIKWAKLKDDGHITDEEFTDARKRLLK